MYPALPNFHDIATPGKLRPQNQSSRAIHANRERKLPRCALRAASQPHRCIAKALHYDRSFCAQPADRGSILSWSTSTAAIGHDLHVRVHFLDSLGASGAGPERT